MISPNLQGLRVLICEDDGVIHIMLRQTMQHIGLDTVADAGTAEEAVALALQMLPDLVLMDVNLQGEYDGIEATRRILQTHSCCVVMLSGLGDEATLSRATEAGACDYLVKPITQEEMHRHLQFIWEGYCSAGSAGPHKTEG